jgi:hypothetical protein
MQVIQTHLTQPTAQGVSHMIAWLPVNPKVHTGSVVSLDKNPEQRWRVTAQFATSELDDIPRGWGLDLPRSQRTER